MTISNFLSKVKDPRSNRGKRFDLSAILRLVVAGLLANCDSIASIARFGKSLDKKILFALGFNRGVVPCHSSLTIILRKIDPDNLFHNISEIINNIAEEDKRFNILHIDGKTLRGSDCFGKKQQRQILTAFNEHFRSIVGYKEIIGKDEQTACIELLRNTNIKDKLVTGDASFAHENICEEIVEQEADFALALKGNEGNLLYYTQETFKQAESISEGEVIQTFEENVDCQHGRIEQRKIEVMDMAFEYLNGHRHIKQLCRITRLREHKNKANSETKEVAYMITSLEKEKATPEQLLSLNRRHWSCENNLNWVKDQIFLEDKSTISVGNAPIVTSLLRSFAISIIATVSDKITATREMFSHYKNKLLTVFATLSSDF